MKSGWPNGSPDYYHINGTGYAKIPVNGNMGEIYAYKGDAIAAIMVWSRAEVNFREYLSVPLSRPLQVGRKYKFTVQVSNGRKDNGQHGGYGIDSLGMVFSEEALVQNQAEVVSPQHVIYIDQVLYNEDWTLLEIEFEADRPARFLTIGNFKDDDHTNWYGFSSYGNEAYYFLDDLNLSLIEEDYYIEGKNRICQNEEVQLIAYGLTNVRWVDSLQSTKVLTFGDTLVHSPRVSTTYLAIGTYNTARHRVEVDEVPDLNLGTDTVICEGDFIILSLPDVSGTIKWSDGDTARRKIIDAIGMYSVRMENSCGVFTDSISVETEQCVCKLYVPNSFTPNADNLNDGFRTVSNCEVTSFNMSIYSRWGELIFETNDPSQSWDGSHRIKEQSTDSFVYKVSYGFRDGSEQTVRGMIRLVR